MGWECILARRIAKPRKEIVMHIFIVNCITCTVQVHYQKSETAVATLMAHVGHVAALKGAEVK